MKSWANKLPASTNDQNSLQLIVLQLKICHQQYLLLSWLVLRWQELLLEVHTGMDIVFAKKAKICSLFLKKVTKKKKHLYKCIPSGKIYIYIYIYVSWAVSFLAKLLCSHKHVRTLLPSLRTLFYKWEHLFSHSFFDFDMPKL